MQDDERCCGTGTCLIDATGRCWCGQQWDGETMCRPAEVPKAAETPLPATSAAHLSAPHARQTPTTPPNQK